MIRQYRPHRGISHPHMHQIPAYIGTQKATVNPPRQVAMFHSSDY